MKETSPRPPRIYTIETSNHPIDALGSGIVARVRNAISDHRTLGYAPTIAAVPSQVAADLDMLSFEAGAGYVFDISRLGASSPIFGLEVVEVADLHDTFLIDGTSAGVPVLGNTRVETDAATGFTKNTTTIRVEASVLYVMRNAQAVYAVGVLS